MEEQAAMERIDDEVGAIYGSTTSASTHNVYIGAIVRFIAWVWSYSECHHLLSAPFIAAVQDRGYSSGLAREWLGRKPFESPVRLDQLGPQDFCRFLVVQRRADGSAYSKSVMDNFRSSLVYLHTMAGVQLRPEFVARLTIFYKGIKRQATRRHQATDERLTEGKEPFSFALYRKIACALICQDSKDSIFIRLFLLLSWNLMCRAANTEAIRLAHGGWVEDSLAIKFSHMKNDQEGERPGDARHVYANPVMPEVCPVLALGMYGMIFGFSRDGKLFPRTNQYDRYTKALKRAMASDDIRVELDAVGLSAADFGSHSARKGAATYVSSCCTAGPSAASVCLRAGWSLPGVQNTYIRFEAAGDMVVGRFVSGLPFEAPEFATQPPFFTTVTSTIERAIDLCFPSAPASFRKVCEFGLASVAYNAAYLISPLPPTHLVFETPLFRDPSMLQEVRQLVQCGNYRSCHPIRPTGIPPHIALLVSLNECKKSIEAVVPAISENIRTVVQEVHSPCGCSAASVESVLTEVLRKHGMLTASTAASEAPPAEQRCPEYPVYSWGGSLRRVPEGFVFPNVTFSTAWQLWCVDDARKGHPPYRLLTGKDVNNKTRKRLSEMQALMGVVENCMRTRGITVGTLDLENAVAALESVLDELPLPRLSKTGRPRRIEQLSWMTLAHAMKRTH